jgi:hypothetical protein
MSSQDVKGGRRSGGYVVPLVIVDVPVPGSLFSFQMFDVVVDPYERGYVAKWIC